MPFYCQKPFHLCPGNEHHLKLNFIKGEVVFAGVYTPFLYLAQNIQCGILLELPRYWGGFNKHNVLNKNKKNIRIFAYKISCPEALWIALYILNSLVIIMLIFKKVTWDGQGPVIKFPEMIVFLLNKFHGDWFSHLKYKWNLRKTDSWTCSNDVPKI